MKTYAELRIGLVAVLSAAACAGQGRQAEAGGTARGCGPVADASGLLRRDSAYIASIRPTGIPNRVQVLIGDTVDLNCDGHADFVAQVVRDGSDGTSALWIIGLARESDGWREILASQSVVDGSEQLVALADLNDDHRRDLIFWGVDEGGFVPRLFVSGSEEYRLVNVPARYTLRFEEQWGADCLQRVVPAVVGSDRIQLARETISPASSAGHGSACDLGFDTLSIVGDSLRRVPG